ncbi:MAG: site-2 protease family protein [Polyangiaceae bacterium]
MSGTPTRVLPSPAWRTNLVLFLVTVVSVFVTAASGERGALPEALRNAAAFTATLLTILGAHELGHYVAARIHKVDASLPYFIPMPFLSPFGTMGAVIRMKDVIPTRKALLDIGAAGPLAGLVFAIPLYAWGVAHSKVSPMAGEAGAEMTQLGTSLLLRFVEGTFGPKVGPGMDLELGPVAFGAWAGLFVTMINLLPVGQLDGGHVAYSLFGRRQDDVAKFVHRAMLAFFFVSLGGFVVRDLRAGIGLHHLGTHVANSMFWLVWFEVLAILSTFARSNVAKDDPPPIPASTRIAAVLVLTSIASFGQGRHEASIWIAWFVGLFGLLAFEARRGTLRPHTLFDHPPTSDTPLDPVRKAIAVVTLAFFVLLFMPTPIFS